MLEYRPRPSYVRLALVSFSQFVIATWLVALVIGTIDSILVRAYDGGTVLYAAPWDTLHREDAGIAAWVAYAFCAFALVLLLLWSSGRTLRGRHFHFVLAHSVAVFGAIRFGLRGDLGDDLPLLGALGLAVIVVILAESRSLALLGNVYDLGFGGRLALWAVRMLPVGALFAWFHPVLMAVLLGVTLLMDLLPARTRFEQVTEPEMPGNTTIFVAAALILTLSVAAFGFMEAQAVVVQDGKASRVPVDFLRERFIQGAGRR
ncbi:MAG TPA: hypothetical protein VGF69_20575 [Thermoanaerobaculia bacterium]|jgi:hypothetical protein